MWRTTATARTRVAMPTCSRPSGVAAKAELTRRFLLRKIGEYHALRLEIEHLMAEIEDGTARDS